MADAPEIMNITAEATLPHSPAALWPLLTDAALISRWLMPTDFQPTQGKAFNFKSQPMGAWNGMVDCTVLEIADQRRLVYSWKGGSAQNAQVGATLDTVVTWTLEPAEGGTKLKMVHAGFKLPANKFAYEVMTKGWGNIIRSLAFMAAERAAAAPSSPTAH